MLDILSIIKDRFDKVYSQLRGTNIYPEESKLRISLPLVNGKGQYIFDIKNATVDGVVEQHLDRNDVFVPNKWGVLIELVEIATGIRHLFSYVPVADGTNPSVHEFGFTTKALENLYAGFLSWNVDNSVMLSTYPMEKFKKVPRQQGAFVLNSSNEAVNEQIQSEWSINNALELIMPRYTIAGTRDHKITVNFPAANLNFPVTAGYQANLVLYMDGFLVKGGCEYKGGAGVNPFGEAVGQW